MAYSINGSNGGGIVHPPVNDSATEITAMHQYSHIRMFRPGKNPMDLPSLETVPTDSGGSFPAGMQPQGWSEPCPASLKGRCRVDFSNICWFYGRDVFTKLVASQPRPIGLIGSYVGGTPDEAWSSPDALKKCLKPPTQSQHTVHPHACTGSRQRQSVVCWPSAGCALSGTSCANARVSTCPC